MTAIAIWCNSENELNPGLWIAADTRVTTSSTVLIEDCSKIFDLPGICRSPDAQGFFSRVTYLHSYGYCFAGNTLMRQNAYLGMTPLLSNLITNDSNFPAMQDVASFVHTYLTRTFDDYKQRVGSDAVFEAALFGWCTTLSRLSVFHFFPKLVDGMYRIMCTLHEVRSKGNFVYLGDQKAYMTEKIAEAFRGNSVPGRPLSRIPRYIIEDHMADDSFPTIGGDLQLGIADRYGFRGFSICKPRVYGQPEAYLSYLGRELTDDVVQVGPARVGGPAIA